MIINQLTMDCPICFDKITGVDKTVLKCNHLFHKDVLINGLKSHIVVRYVVIVYLICIYLIILEKY